MEVGRELLDILACPKCRGELEYVKDGLVCRKCELVYPIRDGIPIMLVEEAKPLRGKVEDKSST